LSTDSTELDEVCRFRARSNESCSRLCDAMADLGALHALARAVDGDLSLDDGRLQSFCCL